MRTLSRNRAMCDWSDFDGDASRIRAQMLLDQPDSISPFHLLSVPGISAQEQRVCSELWTRERLRDSQAERKRLDFRFRPPIREKKLRIGYLSNDFQEHATSHLLVEALEAHDRRLFDIHGFSFGGANDGAMRQRLRHAFGEFHDITPLTDAEAAQTIFATGIDLLIDLKGFTLGARTGILMLRPAPIQVNFLGYPGTMGQGLCDYIMTDAFVTPRRAAADYSEAFAYVSHTYQPHGRRAPLGEPTTRSQVGLPKNGVVFCCFNQAYKITPGIFDIWCRLLNAVPASVLWLLESNHAKGNLRVEALNRGVLPDRLVFAPDAAQPDHLSRLRLADIVLDTTPFGAHTTASDALFAGVPIVTCPGDTFPSRVAGSLLQAIGLPELIAADEDGYFSIALALAEQPARLSACKERLKQNRMRTPLFDPISYARAIEGLYRTMWEQHVSGGPPKAITNCVRAL